MMICENRDPVFWMGVAAHPEVAPHLTLGGGRVIDVGGAVQNPRVFPFASENGGFLMIQLDDAGSVHELHTLYRPEAWSREVAQAAKEMLSLSFNEGGVEVITTREVRGRWRTAPQAYGWVQCGDWRPVNASKTEGRLWLLTRDAWINSPACKRMVRKCH